ncbi:hypothetical protein A2U01_0093677, partial [Trifolium medium]|nr:hypothetical protein [Trifolium medium]
MLIAAVPTDAKSSKNLKNNYKQRRLGTAGNINATDANVLAAVIPTLFQNR